MVEAAEGHGFPERRSKVRERAGQPALRGA